MEKQMLKFIFAGLLLCSFIPCLHAQVTVKYIQPPLNQWHVEDMWNLTVTNHNDKVTIAVFVTVTKSGEGLIIEGTSAPYLLEANYSGPLSADDLTPIDVNYTGNQNYEIIIQKTGTLPEGEYTICVYIKDSETGAELGQDCIVQQIFPISPPALTWPADNSRVIDAYPVFAWLLPTPATRGDVTYTMRIVEQLDGQIPLEAIESNPSWFQEKDIVSTSIQIPVSVREMIPGQNYAWQVAAYIDGDEVGRSEVWSFTYGTPFQIQVDSLIFIQKADEKTSEIVYDFQLYVTNVNDRNANLYATGIIKTNPKSKGATIKPDITPLMIPAGQQGIMTGTISSGKILLEQITVGAMLEDVATPGITVKFDIFSKRRITWLPPAFYDYGDAKDAMPNYRFPSIGSLGAIHKWSNVMAKGQKPNKSCLGKNVACEPCNPILDYIEFETNSEQVNADTRDDGVKFFTPESQYCQQCALDSIEVTFTIGPNYDRSVPLLFHGWFDFNRDGDWDDQSVCPTIPVSTIYEHITWLSARQVCPGSNLPSPIMFVSSQTFSVSTANWGSATCATYILFFRTGVPGTAPLNEMWTRFRLTPAFPNSANADKYSGEVAWGEVEDYPLVCSTQLMQYDFGDAPDELDNVNFHYCTHLKLPDNNCFQPNPRPVDSYWAGSEPDPAAHDDFSYEWLGDINLPPCSTNPMSVNAECNGKTIDQDQEDDGVLFSSEFHFPAQPCDTQVIEVMINSSLYPGRYNWDVPIKLHAWFDWNLDGNWDGVFPECGTTVSKEHIKWLSAQVIGPGQTYPEFPVNSYSFDVVPNEPSRWPNTGNCQIYRLKFLSGNVTINPSDVVPLWCRFRLFYKEFTQPQDVKYSGFVKFGEVEDYIIVPDSTQAACGPFTDPRDGRLYNAVQIGTQCWMAQNLDYSDNGTFIPRSQTQTNNGGVNIAEKYCYADQQINCDNYGGLYNWAEALTYINGASNTSTVTLPSGNIQGICPQGWHLPSDQEWCVLENFIANLLVEPPIDCTIENMYRGVNIGAALKESGTSHWNSPLPNPAPNNISGFSARGGGLIDVTGASSEIQDHGHWWATDQFSNNAANVRHLYSSNNKIGRGGTGNAKTNAHSVRCIRD